MNKLHDLVARIGGKLWSVLRIFLLPLLAIVQNVVGRWQPPRWVF